VFVALGFSALVGVVFGVWPARTAAKLQPVDALRFE
jgi:putative ABC transport system permease protein